MPYRLIYAGLGLLVVAAVAVGILLSPSGGTVDLPDPVESISPEPGSLVLPQTAIEIDFEVGYEARIVVDGWPINDATFVEATGVYRWAPGPDHPTITEWSPGEHLIEVTYNTYTGLPDTGSFEWSFRVG